jgi:trehalose 6-phosphate synthase
MELHRRPIVIVSNRGPVSFHLDGAGTPVARRGAGGLVSGLGPLVRDTGALWVAAAMTDGDREVATLGACDAEGYRIRLLDVDPETWSQHYDRVCNEALWFAHHGLFDPVYAPAWPSGWVDEAWDAYRRVNASFAAAIASDAPDGAVVLVQDYHLCLVAPPVRAARPDLRLIHFSHTPFAPPIWASTLPAVARAELLAGMAAHHACGFHSARWEGDFSASCRAEGVAVPATFVAPLAPDPADLEASLGSDRAQGAIAELDALAGDRALLVRVDRIELSKNVLRGFAAYEQFLEARPDWRERVVFGAFVYPSRQGVADYDRYAAAVVAQVDRVNERFGTDSWTPVHYDPTDDYPRSVAALSRADAVLVNPLRDGLNLVAMEAMLLNRRNGQLILSPEAGAWDALGGAGAWRADPFDVGATAHAIGAALDASPAERAERSGRLRAAVAARTPADWLDDQLAATS